MKDFSRRIGALSPGKLALLKLRLQQEGIDFETEIRRVEKPLFPPVVPAEKKEYYPLSSAQKRMYTLNRLAGVGTVYITSVVKTIRENLSREPVEEAVKHLIKRHESLRTSFEFIAGEPVQRVHEEVEFGIEYYNLATEGIQHASPLTKVFAGVQAPRRGVPIEVFSKRAPWPPEAIIRNFTRPFDLTRAPLLRVGLIKLEEKKYIFILHMHHIITDALSNRIFWDEFNRLYHGQPLPVLKIQYKDFSQWQNRETVKAGLQKQETYWLKEFQGEIPVLHLPIDYPRPVNKNYTGSYHGFRVSLEETAALKALASRQNTTLFVVVLSIYQVFLSKITRQKDIVVGIPIAGRRQAGLDHTLGMFINTLALRNSFREEMSFQDFLIGVRERSLKAFENQDYPFEDLVDRVVKQREPGRNPLFDAFFTFSIPGVIQEMPEGLTVEETASKVSGSAGTPGTSKSGENPGGDQGLLSMFDLYLMGAEIKEEILLALVYSTELFKKETAGRLAGYLKEIIASAAADSRVRLTDIKISHDLGMAASTVLPDEGDDFGF